MDSKYTGLLTPVCISRLTHGAARPGPRGLWQLRASGCLGSTAPSPHPDTWIQCWQVCNNYSSLLYLQCKANKKRTYLHNYLHIGVMQIRPIIYRTLLTINASEWMRTGSHTSAIVPGGEEVLSLVRALGPPVLFLLRASKRLNFPVWV